MGHLEAKKAKAVDCFPDDCLAAPIDASLDADALPDLADPRARFAPDAEALPEVTVTLTPLGANDLLTAAPAEEGAPAGPPPIPSTRPA